MQITLKGFDSMTAEINEFFAQQEDLLIQNLQYMGEAAVKEARLHGSYIDRTGNLRSSIGYVILKDGSPIKHSAPRRYGKGGTDGQKKLQELLDRLAADYPTGITLIVCAGMEYASYVENIHGRDVLTGGRLLAQSLIGKLLAKK